jgi:hypothetical protein
MKVNIFSSIHVQYNPHLTLRTNYIITQIMLKFFMNEEAKEVTVDPRLRLRYAITNYGRLISFTEDIQQDGRFLKGSIVQGYRVLRYKINTPEKLLNKHLFFFRMVAEHFLDKASADQEYVLHLDYNRSNDYYKNLQWATRQEMIDHAKKSPYVIEGRKKLIEHNIKSDGHKLTANKVKFIKKRLADPNRTIRLKMLAKQFGISEMQLYRIKRGENWGHIKID